MASKILTELNRRIKEKNRELEIADKVLDEKRQALNKRNDELKSLEELIVLEKKRVDNEKEINEINAKMEEIAQKEGNILNKVAEKDFVVQLEDGTFEVVGKDDVEIVCDEEIIKNVNKARESDKGCQ